MFHAPAWFNVLDFKSCILHLYCDMTTEGRRVEPEKTAVFRQCPGKQIFDATNIHATIEQQLETVFSVRSMPYTALQVSREC
jgi:hypothetical protein